MLLLYRNQAHALFTVGFEIYCSVQIALPKFDNNSLSTWKMVLANSF